MSFPQIYNFIACETSWKYFRNTGKCYKVYDDLLSWNEAKSVCRQKFGELASVVDKETNKFLKELCFSGFSWVGGVFEVETWNWSDGTEWKFNNWLQGNNSQNFKNAEMAIAISHSDGIWNIKMRNLSFPFICQL